MFILVSSLGQFEAAVRLAYGEIDARAYLEKFYHLRILLPTDSLRRPDITSTYLGFLFDGQTHARFIHEYCKVRRLGLRTLERIFSYAKIALISTPPNGLFLAPIVAGLCIMKVVE